MLENFQAVGAHILQACCKREGLSLQIFYANIHFASYLKEEYELICNMNYTLMGERIFARAAYGDLKDDAIHENVYNLSHVFGSEKGAQMQNPLYLYPPLPELSIQKLREIEELAYRWTEEISYLLSKIPYAVIGCSSSYEQTNSSLALLQRAKKYNPDITTLLGGFNCEGESGKGIASLDPQKAIVDYIFSGESENSLVDFIKNHKDGTKEQNRVISGKQYKDMDDLPEVDYSQYFEQLFSFQPSYAINPQSINISYETSRGCWWGEKSQCLFCGCNGERVTFRQKTPAKVIDELETIKKLGINYLQMTDLIMPEDYTETLIPELEKKDYPFTIYYEQKANLSYEKLQQLKKANICEIQPGIETFSDTLLKQMNKGTSAWKNIKLLRDSKILNINVYWNFIWGFPGEKSQEYEDMFSYLPSLFHLQPPFGVFHLVLKKFSPYYNNHTQYGIENFRPMTSYFEIFPHYADIENIAGVFLGEYEAETYNDPAIVRKLIDLVHEWNESWSNSNQRPLLWLTKNEDNRYTLKDTRALSNTESSYIIDKKRAATILKDGKYTGNRDQEWAVSKKVALVIEDRFVSLITSTPELKGSMG